MKLVDELLIGEEEDFKEGDQPQLAIELYLIIIDSKTSSSGRIGQWLMEAVLYL